jgi:hypothetical protein
MHWFKEMVNNCPNSGGFTVMLNILAKTPDLALVEQVHNTLLEMKDTVTPDVMTVQALITCYGVLRQREQMLQIVRTYHVPAATANTSTASASATNAATTTTENNDTGQDTDTEAEADQDNEEPTSIMDAANYQKALQYCVDDTAAMNEIIDLMLTSSIVRTMDDRRWSSVLDTIARLKSEPAAMRVQELVEQLFPNSVICWTTVVKAWGEADVSVSSDRIYTIYKRLSDANVPLDGPFCTAVLFQLSIPRYNETDANRNQSKSHNDRDFHRAQAMLLMMESRQRNMPTPDCDHYEPILRGFLARSNLVMAKKHIDRRIELALTGANKAAEPVRSTYHQFVHAWVRQQKDLRLLTKTLVEWNKTYEKHKKKQNGPDLIAYEMLFVGLDRNLHHEERTLYKEKIQEIIQKIVRLGERTLFTKGRVSPPPVKLRR